MPNKQNILYSINPAVTGPLHAFSFPNNTNICHHFVFIDFGLSKYSYSTRHYEDIYCRVCFDLL